MKEGEWVCECVYVCQERRGWRVAAECDGGDGGRGCVSLWWCAVARSAARLWLRAKFAGCRCRGFECGLRWACVCQREDRAQGCDNRGSGVIARRCGVAV